MTMRNIRLSSGIAVCSERRAVRDAQQLCGIGSRANQDFSQANMNMTQEWRSAKCMMIRSMGQGYAYHEWLYACPNNSGSQALS